MFMNLTSSPLIRNVPYSSSLTSSASGFAFYKQQQQNSSASPYTASFVSNKEKSTFAANDLSTSSGSTPLDGAEFSQNNDVFSDNPKATTTDASNVFPQEKIG
jgi:hypothetical protein